MMRMREEVLKVLMKSLLKKEKKNQLVFFFNFKGKIYMAAVRQYKTVQEEVEELIERSKAAGNEDGTALLEKCLTELAD